MTQAITGTESDVAIPVLRATTLHRTKTPLVIGVMSAGDLARLFEVPRRDTRTKTGYQREVATSRVNRLVADLKAGRVDLPTAVLVNLRDYSPRKHLIEDDGQLYLNPNGQKLYVVDGQHRIESLAKLVDEDPAKWSEFQIAFVCMLGADEQQEMEQFYVVNSTAKSVRTDLALDLLKQLADNDPRRMEMLIERSEDWKVTAQTLVEELQNTKAWRNRIRFPGQPKAATTISSSGVVASLKQLLASPYFGSITQQNQLRILDAFWQAIQRVIPEAFDEPQSYVLQKGVGVMVMHSLVIATIEYVKSKGKSVVDPDSYVEPLAGVLDDLQGDTASGEPAEGADFWKAGTEGAAGSFSSNAGRRVLVAKMRSKLPDIEVE